VERASWLNLSNLGLLLGLLAVVALAGGSILQHGALSLRQFLIDVWANFGTEFVSIIITVFIIEGLIRWRDNQQRLRMRLVQQLSSQDHEFAVEAVKDLREHGWLEDGTLERINLVKAELQGVDLHNANLQGAALTGADLQAADLSKGNLRRVHMKEADLQRAILTSADLQGGRLSGTDFRGAYMRGTLLQSARLKDVDLQQADLSDANLQAADLINANLQNAKLLNVNLRAASLEGANLQDADLSGANLEGVTLPDGSFWQAGIELARFIDPKHPGFWRSEDPESPAWEK